MLIMHPSSSARLVPAPVKVKTPWIGIDLHGDAMRGAGFENSLDIHLVAGPAQQLAAGHMAEDGRIGIFYRPKDALGLGFRSSLNRLCTLATTKSNARNISSG